MSHSASDRHSAIQHTDVDEVFVQASGLAAGKGVVVPENKQEALDAVKRIMVDKEFGIAGNEVRGLWE